MFMFWGKKNWGEEVEDGAEKKEEEEERKWCNLKAAEGGSIRVQCHLFSKMGRVGSQDGCRLIYLLVRELMLRKLL